MAIPLPLRRRDGGVALRQVQRMQRVPGADPRAVVEADRELGIEAEIGAVGVVVPLAVMDEAGIGVHVLGVERLAPARMGQDRVRHEALAAQAQHLAGDGLPMQGRLLHLAQ